MNICKECLNCKIAIYDPEYGYTCNENHWNYFNNALSCPYYIVDEDYLLKHTKTFLEKIKVKKFIRKNKIKGSKKC